MAEVWQKNKFSTEEQNIIFKTLKDGDLLKDIILPNQSDDQIMKSLFGSKPYYTNVLYVFRKKKVDIPSNIINILIKHDIRYQ